MYVPGVPKQEKVHTPEHGRGAGGKPLEQDRLTVCGMSLKDQKLCGAGQIQSHFQRAGIPLWGSRAEQVSQTAAKFSKDQLERGLKLIFEADRDLRSARPDDRTVVENFVVALCS